MKEFIGGVEKTLIDWIKTIDKNKYKITLYLINVEGELLPEIPDFVNMVKLPELDDILNGSYKKRFAWVLKTKGLEKAIKFFVFCLIHKLTHNRGKYYRKLIKYIPDIKEDYDYVISYTMPDSICVPYAAQKIKGKYKWMWCHNDVFSYKHNELTGMEQSFAKFDKIVNVGKTAKASFNTLFPKLSPKSVLIKNHLDVNRIKELASENSSLRLVDEIKLLTVGRIAYQKGQDIALSVAKVLQKQNIAFKWYFIGPKSEASFFATLADTVSNENLQDVVVYLGQTANPYKYISDCDIYVQPSRFEGYCTTITEAQILNKPIVATDVAGVSEQIINGVTGFIADVSVESLVDNIQRLIIDGQLRNLLSKNLMEQPKLKNVTFEEVIEELKQ